MLNINSPVQWQIRDDKYPTLMPWYTHGMLEEIKKWDLKGKRVWEWGGGWSTIFWAFYCERVTVVETDEKWLNDTWEYSRLYDLRNISTIHRPVNEGDQSKFDFYTDVDEGFNPDIVCIDSILRHECLLKALTLPRPLIIIHDNWQQDGFVCPASEELMAPYEGKVFVQENHTDNHGRKWATAMWHLK